MPARPASLVDEEGVRARVDGALAAHVDDLATELAAVSPDSELLLTGMRTMLAGGKRLRAAFCYWSWRAHGGHPCPGAPPEAGPGQTGSQGPTAADATSAGSAEAMPVFRVGAALEMFQAAALFHDDVMDDSDTRRGQPAAHVAFAASHRTRGWAGSPHRFGESAAILLGDLALIASEREFSAAVLPLPAVVRARTRAVFDAMRTEVTVGQYLDVLSQALPWEDRPLAAEERARSVLRAKSARYSVEHPLTLGAALAGADDGALAWCRDVGLPLGEAFQLRDDLLGVFGDPESTGKPAGDDLREGKRTVLLARAAGAASPAQRALLRRHLGTAEMTPEDVEVLRGILVDTGAVASIEALISELGEAALAAIARADLAEPGRTMLVQLGRAAITRTA